MVLEKVKMEVDIDTAREIENLNETKRKLLDEAKDEKYGFVIDLMHGKVFRGNIFDGVFEFRKRSQKGNIVERFKLVRVDEWNDLISRLEELEKGVKDGNRRPGKRTD